MRMPLLLLLSSSLSSLSMMTLLLLSISVSFYSFKTVFVRSWGCKVGGGGGELGDLYLSLHCHHHSDFWI